MVYQEAGIPRYETGQDVYLCAVQNEDGTYVHPSFLLYPQGDREFLSRLMLLPPLTVEVTSVKEVQPDFFGYKAMYFSGMEERVFVNQQPHYGRTLEFMCGIEPVNHMDYLWHDDDTGQVYIDYAYLVRCYEDHHGEYDHLGAFLE